MNETFFLFLSRKHTHIHTYLSHMFSINLKFSPVWLFAPNNTFWTKPLLECEGEFSAGRRAPLQFRWFTELFFLLTKKSTENVLLSHTHTLQLHRTVVEKRKNYLWIRHKRAFNFFLLFSLSLFLCTKLRKFSLRYFAIWKIEIYSDVFLPFTASEWKTDSLRLFFIRKNCLLRLHSVKVICVWLKLLYSNESRTTLHCHRETHDTQTVPRPCINFPNIDSNIDCTICIWRCVSLSFSRCSQFTHNQSNWMKEISINPISLSLSLSNTIVH